MSEKNYSDAMSDKNVKSACSLIFRSNGEQIEVPVNFGLSIQEFEQIYPFLLPLFKKLVRNPSVKFKQDTKDGVYDKMDEAEYNAKMSRVYGISEAYWYGERYISLLELALRCATDIALCGLDGLEHLANIAKDLNTGSFTVPVDEVTEDDIKAFADDVPNEDDAAVIDESEPAGDLVVAIYGDDDNDEDEVDYFDEFDDEKIRSEVGMSLDKVVNEAFADETVNADVDDFDAELNEEMDEDGV